MNKAIPEAPPRGPKGTLGVRVENLRVNVNKHTCLAPHILGVNFLRQAPHLARRGLSSTAPAHKIERRKNEGFTLRKTNGFEK